MNLVHLSNKDILVISLSNIGDVILTCPVIDVLLRDFPQSNIDVVVGPKAQTLFGGNPRIKVIVFDKKMQAVQFWQWIGALRKKRYQMVIDLRHTMFPILLRKAKATPLFATGFDGHSREKHLKRLSGVYRVKDEVALSQAIVPEQPAFFHEQGYILIAPGAADSKKRWDPLSFVQLANDLLRRGEKIVWVGDQQDSLIINDIARQLPKSTLSLAGQLNLRQLAFVLSRAKISIVHDSGPMHLASYFNLPLVVLWGPTDFNRYGPWSSQARVVRSPDGMMVSIQLDEVIQQLTPFIKSYES